MTDTVPATWFPPAPPELCKCGREASRHGPRTPNTLNGRAVPCSQLADTEARVEFARDYERTPWWRRWRLHTPEGW